MKSRDFAFWLQGFFEISGTENITPEQAKIIKKHLDLVFAHEIDPEMGDENTQDLLNEIHDGDEYPYVWKPNDLIVRC